MSIQDRIDETIYKIQKLDKVLAEKRKALKQPLSTADVPRPVKPMAPDSTLLRGARGMKAGGLVRRGYGKARGA
jgi:hypothetical protein